MDVKRIFSERVLLDGVLESGLITISGGKIIDIQRMDRRYLSSDFSVIDYGNSILMPALCDPHVHINEPGRSNWEGFETATKAAAVGGIATIVDMPLNSHPVTVSADDFRQKLLSTSNKLSVNTGFYGGIVPGNAHHIEAMANMGVLGFKAFLTHSGIDDFPNLTREDLLIAMPIIEKTGLPLLVHCELSIEHSAILYHKQNPTSYTKYLASRPKDWEDKAIEMMIELCELTDCRVHIVHLSSANMVKEIAKAKANLPLSVETAPHYLFFNAEDIQDRATEFKCAPPIREKDNNERLWDALKDGTIDFIGTDHSPAPPDLKHLEDGDFDKAWGGISSLQLLLPVVWTRAKEKGFSIQELSNMLSTNALKFLGFQESKGVIKVGYDADFVVWDPDTEFVVNKELLFHRHKVCPYDGYNLYGKVIATYIGGNLVYEFGKIFEGNGRTILA